MYLRTEPAQAKAHGTHSQGLGYVASAALPVNENTTASFTIAFTRALEKPQKEGSNTGDNI